METILKIEDAANFKIGYSEYDGYKIITDKQEIFFGISNNQDCCEEFGYFITNDDINEFIGAKLINLRVADTSLNIKEFKEEIEGNLDEGDVMFVNFATDKGTLQFTAYNFHNGYYGHEAIIKSTQITETMGL